ncbi:MAG: hypothetical protein AB7O31_02900 [Burkholderiales bacterium]
MKRDLDWGSSQIRCADVSTACSQHPETKPHERSHTMKRNRIAIAVLAAALAAQPLVSAAQTEKPAAKPRPGMQADPKMQQQMMERMKTMQAQMEKIRQTTDPKEREKLLAEHMKSMQEGMQTMRGMGGGMMGMMGGGMGGAMAGGTMGGPRGSGPQSAQMMQDRMDMMQMMMEQMMQHDQMRQQTPGK